MLTINKKLIILKIILFVNINFLFGGGIFSNLDKFSMYGSMSYYSYQESYISESLELINIRPNLSNVSIGIIYNSNYDISFSYLNNSESINIYNFPYVDKYISTKFYYHMNNSFFAMIIKFQSQQYTHIHSNQN